MAQDLFLSVDLDYWTDEPTDRAAGKFFNELQQQDKPIVLVQSHEELLPTVNESGCRRLLNMDAHSDLAERRGFGLSNAGQFCKVKLCDGTWVNHVRWRRRGDYYWMTQHGITCESRQDPFTYRRKLTDWRRIRKLTNKVLPVSWADVRMIGIAWSPDYTYVNTVYRVLSFLGLEAFVPRKLSLEDSECRGWDASLLNGLVYKPRWIRR